jgi:hypothetical protein
MFIDRKELQILKNKLEKTVKFNTGSTVFVAGEPGIGKSTLIQHFLDNCDKYYDVNILTGSGFCFDMDGISRGYLPWKEVLIELDADKMAGKDAERKNNFKKMVKTVFDKSGSEWIQNIPAVGEISSAIMETAKAMKKSEKIDFETGDIIELSFKERLKYVIGSSAGAWIGAIPIIGGLAEAIFKTSKKLMETTKDMNLKNQEGFFLMVDNKLRELATENPIVVFLDNLQWADNSSISLLYYIARKLIDKPYPLLIIGAYRIQEVKEGRFNESTGSTDRHPLEEKINNLERYSAAEVIEIEKFSNQQSHAFVNEKFPDNVFNQEFFNQISNLTKGNPLFLEEILNNLVERDTITKKENIFILAENVDTIQLPNTITAIIKERFERLQDDLQEFLQVASVQGEMFSVDIISSIIGEPSVKTYRKNDILLNKYKLVEKSRKISEGLGDMYQLSHNLIKNYVYYSMSDDYRLRIHRQIAEEYHGVDSENVLLEYIFHYGVGNRIIDEKRSLVLNPAATNNSIVINYIEAQKKIANYYIKSFKNDEGLSICSELIKLSELINELTLKIELLIKQGEIYRIIGKWDEALISFQLAFQFSLKLTNRELLASSSESLSELLRMQAKSNEKTGEWNKAEKMYRESLLYAEHTNNFILVANSLKNLAWILCLQGKYVESVLIIDKATERYLAETDFELKQNGINGLKALISKSMKVCTGIGDETGIKILGDTYKNLEQIVL